MLAHVGSEGTTPPHQGRPRTTGLGRRPTRIPSGHTWFDAWVESAYGTAGFWRVHDPDEHFRTAAASSDLIAELVASILDEQPEIEAVVDVGAGGGQLLGALAALRPELRLSGIDLRARPDRLPDAHRLGG